jgi:hypothetical protein
MNGLNQMPMMIDPFSSYQQGEQQEIQRQAERDQAREAARRRQVVNELYKSSLDPRTGQLNMPAVYSGLAEQGMAEMIPEMQTQAYARDEQRGKGMQAVGKGLVDRMKAFKGTVPADPGAARTWVANAFADPDVGQYLQQYGSLEDAVASVPNDPAQFAEWRKNAALFADEVVRLELEAGEKERERQAKAETRTQTARPALSEVVDPTDPSRMLRIDANAYQGGSLGDPGVLGLSGKIPGTEEGLDLKERKKRDTRYPKDKQSTTNHVAKTKTLITELERLRDHPGLAGMVGPIESRLPTFKPQTANAEAILKTVLARGQFRELQDMRANSPTGGALGNVSNFEIQALQNAFASLDTKQDEESFKAAIDRVIQDLLDSNDRIQNAFDDTYSYKVQTLKPGASESSADDSDWEDL